MSEEYKRNCTGAFRGSRLFLSGLVTVVCLATIFQTQSTFPKSDRRLFLAVNGETLSHLTLGFRLFLSDILWLRLIQDFDHKDTEFKNNAPESFPNLGWSYQMLNSVTLLDPRFKIAYLTGGTVLSVLVRDVEGARRIWERGVFNFPHDWSMLFRAGYHSLYEVKDCKRAAELFERAGREGAPPWAMALATKLYRKTGNYDLARAVVKDAMHRFEGTPIMTILENRLKEIDDAERAQNSSAAKDLPIINSCLK